eukprot:s5420_g2.t1
MHIQTELNLWLLEFGCVEAVFGPIPFQALLALAAGIWLCGGCFWPNSLPSSVGTVFSGLVMMEAMKRVLDEAHFRDLPPSQLWEDDWMRALDSIGGTKCGFVKFGACGTWSDPHAAHEGEGRLAMAPFRIHFHGFACEEGVLTHDLTFMNYKEDVSWLNCVALSSLGPVELGQTHMLLTRAKAGWQWRLSGSTSTGLPATRECCRRMTSRMGQGRVLAQRRREGPGALDEARRCGKRRGDSSGRREFAERMDVAVGKWHLQF